MKTHPDYPIINQVQSFLISQKPTSKYLSDAKCLMQSKHTTDSVSNFVNMASDETLQKISKISPYNVKSCGSDTNANIRSFVCLTLEIAFNSVDTQYKNFFIQKIGKETQYEIKNIQISNSNHESITTGGMIRVINGFLITLQNKKLKNPEEFSLQKQLQNLPIIVDYLIVVFRCVLSKYKVKQAIDYIKFLNEIECFEILSEYLDLNMIRKDKYYFFEDTTHFLYKNQKEFIFGCYANGNQQIPKPKIKNVQPQAKTTDQYDKDYNLRILQCSMESGSNLLSSRHADESTPYFSNLVSETNFFFKTNLNRQNSHSSTQLHFNRIKTNQVYHVDIKNQKFNENMTQLNKGQQSKSSGFQVNVYSQQSLKFFNNKYRVAKNQNHNQMPYIEGKKVNPIVNSPSINDNKNFKKSEQSHMKNQNVKSRQNNYLVKKANERQKINGCKSFTELKRAKSNQCVQQILKFNNKRVQTQQCKHEIQNDQKQDKIFDWENDERRLRRVETICYRTCSTCHRRFYRNQLRSNILSIKIDLKQTENIIQETIFQKKKTDENMTRFHKKSADIIIQPNKHRYKESSKVLSENNLTQQRSFQNNSSQLTWLKRKNKIQNENPMINSEPFNAATSLSPKNWLQKDINNTKNSPANFHKRKSHEQKSPARNDFESIKKINEQDMELNKRNEANKLLQKNIEFDFKQTSPKQKSFLSFKGGKQVQKVKSIGNIGFKQRVYNQNQLIGSKNFEKGVNKVNEGISNKNSFKNLLNNAKSAQKKAPGFLQKQILKNDFDMIMNT